MTAHRPRFTFDKIMGYTSTGVMTLVVAICGVAIAVQTYNVYNSTEKQQQEITQIKTEYEKSMRKLQDEIKNIRKISLEAKREILYANGIYMEIPEIEENERVERDVLSTDHKTRLTAEAKLAFKNKDTERAFELSQALYKEYPNDYEAQFLLGRACSDIVNHQGFTREKREEAGALGNKIFSSIPKVKELAMNFNNWGYLLFGLSKLAKDPQEKKELLEKAEQKYMFSIKHDPKNMRAWGNLGITLTNVYTISSDNEKIFEKANKVFEDAVSLDARYNLLWENWSVLLRERVRSEADLTKKHALLNMAELKIQRALALAPQACNTWILLGWLNYEKAQLYAEDNAQKKLKNSKNNFTAETSLEMTQSLWNKAEESFQIAQAMGRNNAEVYAYWGRAKVARAYYTPDDDQKIQMTHEAISLFQKTLPLLSAAQREDDTMHLICGWTTALLNMTFVQHDAEKREALLQEAESLLIPHIASATNKKHLLGFLIKVYERRAAVATSVYEREAYTNEARAVRRQVEALP